MATRISKKLKPTTAIKHETDPMKATVKSTAPPKLAQTAYVGLVNSAKNTGASIQSVGNLPVENLGGSGVGLGPVTTSPTSPTYTPSDTYNTTFEKTKTGRLTNVNNLYDAYYKYFQDSEQAKADRQKSQNEANTASNTRAAYVNNQLSERNLNASMARQGITGGASETSLLNNSNNLANVQSGMKNNLQTNNSNIANNLTDALSAYKLTNDQNRETALNNARELWDKEQETKYNQQTAAQNKKEKDYANTISRFDTVAKCDAAIKTASKDPNQKWKIKFLQEQKAKLKADAKKKR